MISEYFEDWEVKSEFTPEFVSLWESWLGKENYNKLDKVTELEWMRFNTLIKLIHKEYELHAVNLELNTVQKIEEIENYLPTYKEAMNRDASKFSKLIIPELSAVLNEDWDFTYILWHKNNGAKEILSSFIKNAELFQFCEI